MNTKEDRIREIYDGSVSGRFMKSTHRVHEPECITTELHDSVLVNTDYAALEARALLHMKAMKSKPPVLIVPKGAGICDGLIKPGHYGVQGHVVQQEKVMNRASLAISKAIQKVAVCLPQRLTPPIGILRNGVTIWDRAPKWYPQSKSINARQAWKKRCKTSKKKKTRKGRRA